jgi:predicted metal-binding protein
LQASAGRNVLMAGIETHGGALSIYPTAEAVKIVGYSSCGGCPGGIWFPDLVPFVVFRAKEELTFTAIESPRR